MRYFIGVITIFFLCVFCFQGSAVRAQPPGGAAQVMVDDAIEKTINQKIPLTGTALASQISVLGSETGGIVEAILVEEGAHVEKNASLVRLDSSTLRPQLQAAEAAKKAVEQEWLQAKSDLKRSSDLVKKEVISEKQFLDDQYRARSLQERVLQLEAEIDRLEVLLDKKEIRAPFSGWITEKHVEVGEWIGVGGDVITIVHLDPIHLWVDVPGRYIGDVRTGEEVEVNIDALDGNRFQGKIIAVIREGNLEARTFPVKIEIPNTDGRISSGMVGRVALSLGEPHNALMVPKDALVIQGDSKAVFKLVDGQAIKVPVTLGAFYEDLVEVIGEIRAGDKVVVRGNERLMDEQPVTILEDN